MIQRLRCEWSGTAVEGPGLTTFYSTGFAVASLPAAAAAFFNAWKGRIVSNTTITVPNGGDVIDEATGTLVGTWGSSGSTTVSGTAAVASFAAGVGGRVVWETDVIRNGHRVRGTTFCVPLTTGSYEANGTLAAGAITDIEAGVSAFLTQLAGEGRIWSRPTASSAGAAVPIARGRVPDRVSWLRSRKV